MVLRTLSEICPLCPPLRSKESMVSILLHPSWVEGKGWAGSEGREEGRSGVRGQGREGERDGGQER